MNERTQESNSMGNASFLRLLRLARLALDTAIALVERSLDRTKEGKWMLRQQPGEEIGEAVPDGPAKPE